MDYNNSLQTLAQIGFLIVSIFALRTWQKQLKAKKQIDFIDLLMDTSHSFILSIYTPIQQIQLEKITIEVCKESPVIEYPQHENSYLISYIVKYGERSSEKIRRQLDETRPILSKLQSLITKGQILDLDNYSQCQEVGAVFSNIFNNIEAFYGIICNPNMNWENPIVQERLDNLKKIFDREMEKEIVKYGINLTKFSEQAYKKILK